MSIRKSIASMVAATLLTGGAITGVSIVVAAEPAQAASCQIANLLPHSVDNKTCSSARHYLKVKNAKGGVSTIYAPWVGKGKRSTQTACYVGETGYGAEVKV